MEETETTQTQKKSMGEMHKDKYYPSTENGTANKARMKH